MSVDFTLYVIVAKKYSRHFSLAQTVNHQVHKYGIHLVSKYQVTTLVKPINQQA
jgi:hypothetical protein